MNDNLKSSIKSCHRINMLRNSMLTDIDSIVKLINKLDCLYENKDLHCQNTLLIVSIKNIISRVKLKEITNINNELKNLDLKMNDALNDLELKNVEF